MIAAVNRGIGVKNFQKEFNMKDAIYAVANACNAMTKYIVVHTRSNLWPTMSRD